MLGQPESDESAEIIYVVDDDGIDAIVLSIEFGSAGSRAPGPGQTNLTLRSEALPSNYR
jgi:hypothetical protein